MRDHKLKLALLALVLALVLAAPAQAAPRWLYQAVLAGHIHHAYPRANKWRAHCFGEVNAVSYRWRSCKGRRHFKGCDSLGYCWSYWQHAAYILIRHRGGRITCHRGTAWRLGY